MTRRLSMSLLLLAMCGCGVAPRDVWHNIVLPEQRGIEYRDAAELPSGLIPANTSPKTVSDPRPEAIDWPLSLDEAIRIALEKSRTIRVLTGTSATASGKTIYDAAITNTTIDQQQARFDPVLKLNNQSSRTNTPSAILDPTDFSRSRITSTPATSYLSTLGLTKDNVHGGQAGLTWVENPTRFAGLRNPLNPFLAGGGQFPLNPQNASSVELSYTQPLLQGAGFRVNTAPIVIARLNTEISFFQYKDSVQEMVRGVIEAYWSLVQARRERDVRKEQVKEFGKQFQREEQRLKAGLGNKSEEALARITFSLFQARLVAAEASVLTREGALRNILGLPPTDDRFIVPTSTPANERLPIDWDKLVQLAEQRRPDIIELKIIIEAEQQRLLQAENQMLPKLDAVALYRWNGLNGTMPNGDHLSTSGGKYNDWTLGINFSVPLGLRQGRAVVRQEKLLIERDRANLEQGLHSAIHELTTVVRELASAYEQYLAYKVALAAAEINEKVQSERVNAGIKTGFDLEIRQAIVDRGDAKINEAAALMSYNIALANLERSTGTILETHGLVFHEERTRAAGPLGLPSHQRWYPSALIPAIPVQPVPARSEPADPTLEQCNLKSVVRFLAPATGP